ncbi:MAG: TraR/DksA family transcriptional regulator [Mariniblastus sp.]|nr:TraR/DksA family transcriptional regulator [Mariniblastus sp.]
MNRKESIKEIRESLIERRDALRQALNGDDSLLRELSTRQGGDEVDFATDCARGEISSQLAEVESRELHYIENAIKRIHESTYGDCEACGCRIPLERLRALPYASCCIKCKIKAEEHGVEPSAVADWSIILGTNDDFQINPDVNIS